MVTIDRSKIDVRAGVVGLVVIAVLALTIAVRGPAALATVIGALVVLATDPPPRGRSWLVALLPIVVVGTVVTAVAVAVGEQPVAAALLIGGVAAAGALQAGRSERAGTRNLIATLWVVSAFTLHGTDPSPWDYAGAFALGGVIGIAVAALRARRATPEGMADDDTDPELPPQKPVSPGEFVRGPIGRLALLRGVGVAVAVFVGITAFPAHPSWIAITALIVMRPPTRRAVLVGVQRSLGTSVGILVAVVVASVVGENQLGLVLLFLTSAFLMMTVREANYALFAALVTALVIYTQRIVGADATESGRDRFLETLIGVAIALVVLAVAERRSASPADAS
jgi:hypothetical protein